MAKHQDILNRPLLCLLDPNDWCLRRLIADTLIIGVPGSGKTSASGKQPACALHEARTASVQDATASAVNDAAQPDPCNPQKGQGKKQ